MGQFSRNGVLLITASTIPCANTLLLELVDQRHHIGYGQAFTREASRNRGRLADCFVLRIQLFQTRQRLFAEFGPFFVR